jgi:hypothetical protein
MEILAQKHANAGSARTNDIYETLNLINFIDKLQS